MVVQKGQKRVERKRKGKGLRHISFVVCINAAGKALPPTFLFAGKRVTKNLMSKDAPEDCEFMLTDKGYMDSAAWLTYIQRFLSKVKERPLIIVTDGHKTRDAAALYCAGENVEVFRLQSHTTHCTQPLDVSVFAVFKQKWNKDFDTFCAESKDLNNGVDRATITALVKGSSMLLYVLNSCLNRPL
ncbi:MAG: hypothetical protein AABX37_00655 [Nanoarchaeota archaeon]